MICSHCGKREVEVLIKQVINQEVHNLNLCRVCAEELGFVSPQTQSITISLSLGEIEPTNIRKKKNVSRQKREQFEDSIECSVCGTLYGDFRETGFLGCSSCYEAFRFPLGAFLQREQGAESHWGGLSEVFSEIKTPPRLVEKAASNADKENRECEIRNLKARMLDAVKNEEYERAAELRDILRPLLAESIKNEDDV